MHEGQVSTEKKYPERSTPEDMDVYTLGSEHIDLYFLRNFLFGVEPAPTPTERVEALARAQVWDDEKSSITPALCIDEFRKLGSVEKVLAAHPDWAGRMQRILAADYTVPIIVYKEVVLDGLHRIVHATIAGAKNIPAHLLATLPSGALADPAVVRAIELAQKKKAEEQEVQ